MAKVVIDEAVAVADGRGVLVGQRRGDRWLVLGAVETSQVPEGAGLDEDGWAVEHAQQVAEALPGGLAVVGVFELGDAGAERKLLAFAEGACGEGRQDRLVLTKRGGKLSLRLSQPRQQLSLSYETREDPLGELTVVRASAHVDLAAESALDLVETLETALSDVPAVLVGHDGTVFADHRLPVDDDVSEGSESSGVVAESDDDDAAGARPAMKLFMPSFSPVCESAGQSGKRTKSARLRGDVQLMAVVERGCLAADCIRALKEDLVRTLSARLDMVLDRTAESRLALPVRAVASNDSFKYPTSTYVFTDELLEGSLDDVHFIVLAATGAELRQEDDAHTSVGLLERAGAVDYEDDDGDDEDTLPARKPALDADAQISPRKRATTKLLLTIFFLVLFLSNLLLITYLQTRPQK